MTTKHYLVVPRERRQRAPRHLPLLVEGESVEDARAVATYYLEQTRGEEGGFLLIYPAIPLTRKGLDSEAIDRKITQAGNGLATPFGRGRGRPPGESVHMICVEFVDKRELTQCGRIVQVCVEPGCGRVKLL